MEKEDRKVFCEQCWNRKIFEFFNTLLPWDHLTLVLSSLLVSSTHGNFLTLTAYRGILDLITPELVTEWCQWPTQIYADVLLSDTVLVLSLSVRLPLYLMSLIGPLLWKAFLLTFTWFTSHGSSIKKRTVQLVESYSDI